MSKVERLFPENTPAAVGPYSTVTIVGDMVFVSGQIPLNPKSNTIQSEDIGEQTHQVMKNLKAALEGADSNLSHVAKCTILLTDIGVFPKVNEIYASYFQEKQYPARICYAVKALPKNAQIQIDAIAVRAPITDTLKKKIKLE